MSILKIKEEDRGKRLDVFLTEHFSEKSRSFWQKQIKAGTVLVNDKMAKAHEWLKKGDKIEIQKSFFVKIVKSQQEKLKHKIIFEDPDYLIIEKPAGLLTHGTNGEKGLADRLIKGYPKIEKVGEKYRWGIVHRLDRDVSGVLLAARTQDFFKHIKKQFKDRKIKKIYLALVYGRVEKDEGDIDFAISRSKSGKMVARAQREEGKEAQTHFEVLERFKNYTYLQVQILTGRTHQIRTHMLAFGHPLVGDKLYKQKRQKIKEPCDLGRIFLHSHLIGFESLNGEWKEYKSKPPRKLRDCLEELS